MLQLANWNQGVFISICISGLLGLKYVSMTTEIANVASVVSSATQRMAFFHSGFKNKITRMPTRGKKVVSTSGWSTKFMSFPQLYISIPRFESDSGLTHTDDQITNDEDHTNKNRKRIITYKTGLQLAHLRSQLLEAVSQEIRNSIDNTQVDRTGKYTRE